MVTMPCSRTVRNAIELLRGGNRIRGDAFRKVSRRSSKTFGHYELAGE